MATQGFRTILFVVFLGFLVIFASFNLFTISSPIFSYEVTDQNSEGVFSSLSRDFDKTIEEINNNDISKESEDQDTPSQTPTSTPTSTPNSNEKILNSTSTSDTASSNNDVSNSTTS